MPTLEHLIKQPKFRSEQHKAAIGILYANNLINNHYEQIFKKFDLTLQQFNALRILRGQYPKPCTINLIRERMLDRMSDASRIIERVRKAGLAERVTSQKDRRAVDVIITQKGLDLLAQIDKLDSEMDLPTSKLSNIEAQQFNLLLQRVFESVL